MPPATTTSCGRHESRIQRLLALANKLWRTSTIAQPGDPGGDTWGDLPTTFPRRRRRLDSGQLRPGDQPHLLVHLAGQAVGAAVARHRRRRALHEQRARPRPGDRQARLVLHDLDDVFESVLIDHHGRQSLFKMGKLGILSEVEREPHPPGDLAFYSNPRWTGWQSAGRLPHPKSPDHDGR